MLPLVVVVPQLGGDEDILALDKAFFDGSLDTLPGLLLVLVVVCTIKQAIPDFDGLVLSQRLTLDRELNPRIALTL
jgi:hypothetical protein